MSFFELYHVSKNIYFKHKNSWEQSRLIAYIVTQCNSTKKLNMLDLIPFSWDKKNEKIEVKEVSQEQLDKLKFEAENLAKRLNKI